MDQMAFTKVSVRDLVEFVLMQGDLVSSFIGNSRTIDAIKAHQLIQKTSIEDYTAEVSLSYTVIRPESQLEVGGRADGIIKRDSGIFIDEIKTTTRLMDEIAEDYNLQHWAQAKCYAFIYGAQEKLDTVGVQLTYYQLDTKERKYFTEIFTLETLSRFFFDLVDRYLAWAQIVQSWINTRDASINTLQFPFPSYRRGQRELMIGVYKTIKESNKLFAQAPTGIGKTMATLFPAVKSLGEGYVSKIFYLTAKTMTRTIAEKAFSDMRKQGLKIKTLTLTAKEKICFNPDVSCSPEECEYAKGHYDRLHNALSEVYHASELTRTEIEKTAHKHRVCPFEFSLDLAYWADVVICDYNYVFDPRVYLRRFFAEGTQDFVFLVDEAHNLVDRAREMFSAELWKQPFWDLKKATKVAAPDLSKNLQKLNTYFVQARKISDLNEDEDVGIRYRQKEPPKEIYPLLRNFVKIAERYLAKNEPLDFREPLLDAYFQANSFLRTAESFDECYMTYFENVEKDFRIKLFCLDPSKMLQEALGRGKASVLFSATLSPMDYFMKILGGEDHSYKLKIASPFPEDNLCLLVEDRVSTKFSKRILTYDQVAECISMVVTAKIGNYIIFFPSYQYLMGVAQHFEAANPGIHVLYQNSGMTESQREDFLSAFTEGKEESLVGFAVMGGIFGEGIDLVGERLSGAVIVGVGLPQICFEREIIREYFQETQNKGFEFSYIYPGMNKVLQAVGRVIRTEHDRGVVLLIDERFSHSTYKNLFPTEWHPVRLSRHTHSMTQLLKVFWNGHSLI